MVSKNTGHVIVYTVAGTSKAVAVALIYYSSDKEHTLVRCDVLQFAIYIYIYIPTFQGNLLPALQVR